MPDVVVVHKVLHAAREHAADDVGGAHAFRSLHRLEHALGFDVFVPEQLLHKTNQERRNVHITSIGCEAGVVAVHNVVNVVSINVPAKCITYCTRAKA